MICEVPFPEQTYVNGKEGPAFFRDCFQVEVNKAGLDAKQVYQRIFGFIPKPVQWALKARNLVMEKFGFRAGDIQLQLSVEEMAVGRQAGFLTLAHVAETEVVSASSEANMDIWISVLRTSDSTFAISTLVNLKTPASKLYMLCIKPFHKLIAVYTIKQALKAGRI